MANDESGMMLRRRVLKMLGLITSSATLGVSGVAAAAEQVGGVIKDLPGASKVRAGSPAQILQHARQEFAVGVSGTSATDGLLRDGLVPADAGRLQGQLQERTRGIVKALLQTNKYDERARVQMKHIMLEAEGKLSQVVGQLTRRELDVAGAREAARAAMAAYVAGLETLPVSA